MIRVLAYMNLNLYEFTQNSSVLIKLVFIQINVFYWISRYAIFNLINLNINDNSISLWSRSSDGRAPDLSEQFNAKHSTKKDTSSNLVSVTINPGVGSSNLLGFTKGLTPKKFKAKN